MPELPEVETIKRSLEEKIIGKKIKNLEIMLDKVIKNISPEEFKKLVKGLKVSRLERRGKYILIFFDNDMVLVTHLRMTGQLIYCKSVEKIPKHTHLIFNMDRGYQLRYIDIRQFGGMYLVPSDRLSTISGLKFLGIEPFSPEFTKEWLRKELRTKRTKIKLLLLDQTFLAGVGNIYADEALHRAMIDPEKTASTLNARDISRLFQAIREVLKEGIAHRGTSVKDYVDGEGKSGGFQNYLRVYGRENQACIKCKTPIKKKKVGGRSSYYCPRCQK